METYDQFRIVVGHYARCAVATGMCDATTLCKARALFNILSSLSGVQALFATLKLEVQQAL